MTSVEEIIDAVRASLSPYDTVSIAKSAPLHAKLRLLAHVVAENESDRRKSRDTGLAQKENAERSQEWYEVEAGKFYKKPGTYFYR